jgi:hypothetical protein
MRKIRYTRTLIYCDGDQLIEAEDAIGGHYLGLLIEQGAELDRYLVVGVSPSALQSYKLGRIDLRAVICRRELDEWYLAQTEPAFDRSIELTPQTGEIPESHLPSGGFLPQPLIDIGCESNSNDLGTVFAHIPESSAKTFSFATISSK